MNLSRRAFLGAASAALLGSCTGSERPAPHAAGPTPRGTAGPAPPAPTTAGGAGEGPASFVAHGPRDSGRVAFTFHGSGDVGLFHELLAAAQRAAVPITIFAVGSWI